MDYVMSNVHGCYSQFVSMLEKIKFKDTDHLFILGDLVDIGDESLDLIADLSVRENIWTIAGEHDRTAFRILSRFDELLRSGGVPDDDYKRDAMMWAKDGGQKIMLEFSRMNAEEREGVLDYLSDLPGFDFAEVGGKEYLLTHSGVANFEKGKDIYDYDENDFCSERGVEKFPGMTVLCGHRPTTENYDKSGCIYHGDGFIAVDCGAARGGSLGCLRLDDMKEFYVS